MTTLNQNEQLRKKYPLIVLIGKQLGSYSHYVVDQLHKAEETGAPRNAVYERDGKWFTADEFENVSFLQDAIRELLK